MYILPPSISKKIEGYRWQSFTPPAAGKSRRFRGLICHRRSHLLSGSKNSYIATLVERQTRYVMLVKVANKETLTVVSALIRQARKLPTELYKSLTWDRGKELADHRRFSLATAMSLSLLKFVGQASLVDDAMLPS